MRKVLHSLAAFAAPVVLGLIAFFAMSATAFAANAAIPDGDSSVSDMAHAVYDAITSGHYIASAALALIFMVALVRRYGGLVSAKLETMVHSDVGVALTTLLLAFGGALATSTLSGDAWHWAMLWTSATVAFAAAGSYAMLKALVYDKIVASDWYKNKAPEWFKLLFGVLGWIFDKPDAVKQAEQAGKDAVAANPSQGLASIEGKPTELK